MSEPRPPSRDPDPAPSSNRAGRILIIVLGLLALTFIVAAITSNMGIWARNDAADAINIVETTN